MKYVFVLSILGILIPYLDVLGCIPKQFNLVIRITSSVCLVLSLIVSYWNNQKQKKEIEDLKKKTDQNTDCLTWKEC